MINKEIKGKILEIFNNASPKPDTEFDESHFLDFLTYPPHKKDSLKTSFKGTKKYYRFMDMLELEFGICFKLSDLDRYYTIDGITEKVLERLQKAKGNKMVLKQRKERKQEYLIDVALVLILVTFYAYWGLHWLTLIVTAIIAKVFHWIYSSRKYEKKHVKRMELRLAHKET